MAISDQLAELAAIKADIKDAIAGHGIDVPNDLPFDEYADLVMSIGTDPE